MQKLYEMTTLRGSESSCKSVSILISKLADASFRTICWNYQESRCKGQFIQKPRQADTAIAISFFLEV